MPSVEEIYKNFGILADAGEEASKHPEAYQSMIDATKGATAEKKLACQFIPRFFVHFQSLSDAAINAQLDLCEDDETPIRRQAIRSLPEFCKTSNDFINKITDILTQLLQQEDAVELKIVKSGLQALIRKDPQGALSGIFSQIADGDDLVREKAIQFVSQLATGGVLDGIENAGEALLQEIRKILSDVTGEEFTSFIAILGTVKSISSKPQNLADIITEQAELDKTFLPTEVESLDRLICCTRQALPFFGKGASPATFMEHLFNNVFPKLDEVPSSESVNYKYEVLKLITELSTYSTEDVAKQHIQTIFDQLMECLPVPSDEEIKEEALQKLDFSSVECFIFILHKLGAKNPEFLTAEDFTDKLKEFRTRLQYFGRMVQAYVKQLKMSLQGSDGAKLEESDNKLKVVVLRTCNNIYALLKDFLRNPPSYKCNIQVSWKSKANPLTSSNESVEEKRKRAGITPISLENLPAKKERAATGGAKGTLYSLPSERKGVRMDEYENTNKNKRNSFEKSPGRRGGRGGNRGGRRNSGGGGGWNRKQNREYGSKQEAYENFLKR